MGNQVTCQNCGAMGEVGSVCAYCGSTIALPALKTTKRTRKKSSKSSANKLLDYCDDGFKFFWLGLVQYFDVPADVFDFLNIVNVYQFWIPSFLLNDKLKSKKNEEQIEQIRDWFMDRSFEDTLPHDFPKSRKTIISIIDYEYKDQKCLYIYFNDAVPPNRQGETLTYDYGLPFYDDEIDDYYEWSCNLSKFPETFEEVVDREFIEVKNYSLDVANKNLQYAIRKAELYANSTPFKDFFTDPKNILLIILSIISILFVFLGFVFPDTVLHYLDPDLCVILYLLLFPTGIFCLKKLIPDYVRIVDEKNRCQNAPEYYEGRIKVIEATEDLKSLYKLIYNDENYTSRKPQNNRNMEMEIYIDKKERAFWAYRKMNPAPLSSCVNYYKML